MSFIKQSIAIVVLGAFLFALNLVWGFSEPSSSPPLGNVPAPLNVSSSGQSKSGGLILNTGGASYGLIIQNGFVGIGTLNPTQALDVAGYVKGQSGLCIGSDCRTGWPTSSGGLQSETDPTVPASIKDGISWDEVSGKPFNVVGQAIYKDKCTFGGIFLTANSTSDGCDGPNEFIGYTVR